MGREIKRVPLDFETQHQRGTIWPGYDRPCKPCPECGERADERAKCDTCWGDRTVPDKVEPPTGDGWQVWETVSEGSPISPVFATAEELARHLSTVGDDWDVKRRSDPSPFARSLGSNLMPYENALRFVQAGWAPSMVMTGGVLMTGAEFIGQKPSA